MTSIDARAILLRNKFAARENRFQTLPNVRPGILGKGNAAETLEVPGRTGYVYVRMIGTEDSPVVVLNTRVRNVYAMPVIVGYDIYEPFTLQVLGANSNAINIANDTQNVYNAYLTDHHSTHEWMNPTGGNDVVYSELRQIMPLRPSANNGLIINIARGWTYATAGWQEFANTNIDLSSYVPESGALFALVYINDLGALTARTGNLATDEFFLLQSDIPTPQVNETPICAVKLLPGQTEIVESEAYTDLIDLRFTLRDVRSHQWILDQLAWLDNKYDVITTQLALQIG
jgi:hypothetical protein